VTILPKDRLLSALDELVVLIRATQGEGRPETRLVRRTALAQHVGRILGDCKGNRYATKVTNVASLVLLNLDKPPEMLRVTLDLTDRLNQL
jgi:predicted membrane GTPase involved in stress response